MNEPLFKKIYLRDADYRAWIRERRCIFCKYKGIYNRETMACHAYTGGRGLKCSDEYIFPGCFPHHEGYDGRSGPTRREFMIDFPDIDLKQEMLDLRARFLKEQSQLDLPF